MAIRALCIVEDTDRPTLATFAGLRRGGIDLRVLRPGSEAARAALEAAGVPLVDLRIRRSLDVAAVRALRTLLREDGYDVLHLFGNRALQNGLLAAVGLPVRVIAYRGIVGNVSFASPVSWLRFLNPRINRIVCVADAVREYFLAMRPAFLRLPPERLVTIRKGHSLDWYVDPPADLRALGVPADAFVVGCVANYRPRKGIEYLIDAVAGLPAEANVRLLLVGRMDDPRVTAAVERSGAAERIHRVGLRPNAPALAAACDVFVLPSIRREGLPRSVIEAMAYGVPPIVTDCGGSPELVVDGESGIVVPVRDAAAIGAAIERLRRDPALRARMGAAARERIRTSFRIEDTIRQTLELYRSLVPG